MDMDRLFAHYNLSSKIYNKKMRPEGAFKRHLLLSLLREAIAAVYWAIFPRLERNFALFAA